MQTSYIDDIHRFYELKEAWDAIYSADPYATVFVSWTWLRGWIEGTPDDWFVLAVRPDNASPYVAFLPLFVNRATRGRVYRGTLQMGGDPWADHAGLVCLPGYEEETIDILAEIIQKELKWEKFYMRDVLDPRLVTFSECFSREKFNVRQLRNTSCPYISLPDSWDQYLQDSLGSKWRRNLRRSFRQIDDRDEFHITCVQTANLGEQVEALLKLWQMRWGSKPADVLDLLRRILYSCFEDGQLWLAVLWDVDRPVSALGAFVDWGKSTFSAYLSGYDVEYAKLSPSRAILGYAIRYAIENKFQMFDFLRGAEDYKYSFGVAERFNVNVIISRKNWRMAVTNIKRKLAATLFQGSHT